jgi:diguanylate cyclase (GGDEF)-like protein
LIHCTVSGGVAAYPASGTTMDELFHAADVALYEAKNAGRNLVRLHPSQKSAITLAAHVL